MPHYRYECPECGLIELAYRMGAAPSEAECPACGSVCKKRFSIVAIHFHGTGFTRALVDRPDERIAREIRDSQDSDPVLGKTWEEIDREMAQAKADGLVRKKEFHLPPEGVRA